MKLRNTILCIAISTAFAMPGFAETVKGGRVVAPKVPNPAMAKAPAAGAKAAAPKAPVVETVNLPALSADQIVEKNVAARGGLAAWQRVQAMSMTGTLDAGKRRRDGGNVGMVNSRQAKAQRRAEALKVSKGGAEAKTDNIIQLPFQMEMKRPLKSRLEVQFNGDTAVQVYDGTNGWKLRPFLGRHEVEPFTPAEQKVASLQQPLDGPLIDYRAKGTKVEVLGGEKVDGRGAYKLKLTLKNGEVRHVWVDAQTFLDVKIDGAPRRVDGKERTVETVMRDYKSVDGVMVPYLFETHVDGMPDKERIVVERVAMNPPLDDARFGKPQ